MIYIYISEKYIQYCKKNLFMQLLCFEEIAQSGNCSAILIRKYQAFTQTGNTTTISFLFPEEYVQKKIYDVQLSERLPSLGIMGGQLRVPLKPHGPPQHYPR